MQPARLIRPPELSSNAWAVACCGHVRVLQAIASITDEGIHALAYCLDKDATRRELGDESFLAIGKVVEANRAAAGGEEEKTNTLNPPGASRTWEPKSLQKQGPRSCRRQGQRRCNGC